MKPAMIGTETMVVSPHGLASAAGARILDRGGNAFDAAVAVSACLAVVYPHMTGLGGDSFWLTYQAGEGSVRAYNGSGRSGHMVDREAFAGEDAIPIRGVRSAITVPGMVDAWDAVIAEYGRLSLEDVLEPAFGYAQKGFPLSPDQYEHSIQHAGLLTKMPSTAKTYMPGQGLRRGQRFVQSDLAASLRAIATGGKEMFYQGELAKRIVGFFREEGGLLIMDDFADHRGEWVDPITTRYRGYDVYQVPPNSQGFTGLMALNILEAFDLHAIGHGTYEYYHTLVEALKLTFIDRNRHLTDPAYHTVPLDRLLSRTYTRDLISRMDPYHALDMPAVTMGNDTAYAAVIDAEGNAVSFIQSLYFEFGSGVVAGDTGILLQNRGSFFSLDPRHVNCLEPHKRSFHTLMPAMACLDGKPSILYGTQGGEGQPQTQTAILTRMIDYGMDPQQAVAEPRFLWGRTWGAADQNLKLEGRIDDAVIAALAGAGHRARKVKDWDGCMGHAHAIRIDASGFRIGGTDPRSDGAAIGW